MRAAVASVGITAVLLAAGCANAGGSAKAGTYNTQRATVALVGTWKRINSCSAFVQAFERAGLKSREREWLVGGGYFQHPAQVHPTHPCHGAQNLKHSHFFTPSGAFGSYDQTGKQVDDGNYKIVTPNTLAFPSHTRDFGYKITVHYTISNGKLRFVVLIPKPCTGKCPEATAWAISGFYPGHPFTRAN